MVTYLLDSCSVVQCLICIPQPTNTLIPYNTQLFINNSFLQLVIKLCQNISHYVLVVGPLQGMLEDLLYTQIACLEDTSAPCRHIVDNNVWVIFLHPITEHL